MSFTAHLTSVLLSARVVERVRAPTQGRARPFVLCSQRCGSGAGAKHRENSQRYEPRHQGNRI